MALSNIVSSVVLNKYVEFWLQEDVSSYDMSVIALGSQEVSAQITMKEVGVLAGLPFAEAVFQCLECNCKWKRCEGELIEKGTVVAEIHGLSNKLLMAERTALNILSRACGVATVARRVHDNISSKWKGEVAGTRKTSPGMRIVEKYAMLVGGISTHRYDLSSMVMLKDNHVQINGSIIDSVRLVREKVGRLMKVEVECQSMKEALEAAKSNADVIMLDNFSVADVKSVSKQVKAINPSVLIEVSGGINENNILEYAVDNVDIVSSSIFCQGYKCIDLSLNIVKDIIAFVPEIIETINDTTAALDVEVIDVDIFDKTNDSVGHDSDVVVSPKAGIKRKMDESAEKSEDNKPKVTPASKVEIKKPDEKSLSATRARQKSSNKPVAKNPRLGNSANNGRLSGSLNSGANNSSGPNSHYMQQQQQQQQHQHQQQQKGARMPGHPVNSSTPRGTAANNAGSGNMGMMRAMAAVGLGMSFPGGGHHQPSDAFFTGAAPMRYGGTAPAASGRSSLTTLADQRGPLRPIGGGGLQAGPQAGSYRFFCKACNYQNPTTGPLMCRMCRKMLM